MLVKCKLEWNSCVNSVSFKSACSWVKWVTQSWPLVSSMHTAMRVPIRKSSLSQRSTARKSSFIRRSYSVEKLTQLKSQRWLQSALSSKFVKASSTPSATSRTRSRDWLRKPMDSESKSRPARESNQGLQTSPSCKLYNKDWSVLSGSWSNSISTERENWMERLMRLLK